MLASTQSVYEIYEHQKSDLLLHLLDSSPDLSCVLIFLRSRETVHQLTTLLHQAGVAVESIHGTTKIENRERALHDLKAGKLRVLVSTNAIVRDFDLSEIPHLIYYEFHERDQDYLDYLKIPDRTIITFVTQNEHQLLHKLETLIARELPRHKAEKFDYDAQPKYLPPVRPKGYRPNKTGSKPLQHKKPKLKNKGPRRKTGRTRKR